MWSFSSRILPAVNGWRVAVYRRQPWLGFTAGFRSISFVYEEVLEPWFVVQMVETWVDAQIGNPARPLLNGAREPGERFFVVAEGRLDQTNLVGEETFLSAKASELARDFERLFPVLTRGECMTEPSEHDRVVR